MAWNGNIEAQRQADEAFARMKASVKKSKQAQPSKRSKRKKQPRQKIVYRKYIASKKWQSIKAKLFAVRGKACEQCGSISNIHVHHLTYKNLGHERPEDLQVLCKDCHATLHESKGVFSELSMEYFEITKV